MRTSKSWFVSALLTLLVLATGARAASTADGFLGRWGLTVTDGGAGWLEVKQENGWLDGSLLWIGGSVSPVASVTVANDVLTVTTVRNVKRKDAEGKVLREHQLTDTFTIRVQGDTLTGTRVSPRNEGTGYTTSDFTGKRIPALPPRPDLAAVKFGPAIPLFNGKDLSGWRVMEEKAINAWAVDNGVLVNRPPANVPGQPWVHTANLRTTGEFEDFNLTLEVNIPKGSNSGVYLRGIYEVQVFDSYEKGVDSHHMGAIYSRITPTVSAERPPGEWQTLDITLVDRHVTVLLNGTKIIDNQPVLGCTGGALWADEFRPGPIYLQGDHGAVSYRNLVLRPVVR